MFIADSAWAELPGGKGPSRFGVSMWLAARSLQCFAPIKADLADQAVTQADLSSSPLWSEADPPEPVAKC